MNYHRVTQEERMHIYRWRQEDRSQAEIAKLLNRSPSTISREIKRNKGQRGYRPSQAQEMAHNRAKRLGPRRFTESARQHVEKELKLGMTPEIISARARLSGEKFVCKETIYQHIYKDSKSGGDLWSFLPRSHRKRRRRMPKRDGQGRGKIPNQRRIDTRPVEVETRQIVGHWEGDLINGANGTGNLVTLVERHSRFALVGRTQTKAADEVLECIYSLFSTLPKTAYTGITFDNGKEFALHEDLARLTKMDVYFAYPYHSWERGSNENLNGLIRRLYPKKSSFADINHEELVQIEGFLNDRPRKCLGWLTPREVMSDFLDSA